MTDLHADTVTFVEKGSVTEQPFDIGAFLPGLMLVAIGFIMLIVFLIPGTPKDFLTYFAGLTNMRFLPCCPDCHVWAYPLLS